MKRVRKWLGPAIVTCALIGACGGGGKDDVVDPPPDSCDAPSSEHGQLLNAPTTATVVVKQPSHPPLEDGELPE